MRCERREVALLETAPSGGVNTQPSQRAIVCEAAVGVTVGLDSEAGDDSSAAISVAICSDDWNSPKPVATALSRVCARADVSDEATLAGFSTRVPFNKKLVS